MHSMCCHIHAMVYVFSHLIELTLIKGLYPQPEPLWAAARTPTLKGIVPNAPDLPHMRH